MRGFHGAVRVATVVGENLVREVSRASLGAVEGSRVVSRISSKGQDLVVLAGFAMGRGGTEAASALARAWETFPGTRIKEVVTGALHGALLLLDVGGTLLADVCVISVAGAALAEAVAGPADWLSSHDLQLSLRYLRSDVFVEGAVWANLLLLEALKHLVVAVDERLLAGDAAVRSEVAFRPVAAADAVGVARHALAQRSVVVLPNGALLDAERSVFGVPALGALVSAGSRARPVTLLVALHALAIAGAVETQGRIAAGHALELHLEALARQAKLVSGAPTAFGGALLVADVTLLVAALRRLVSFQHGVVVGRLHQLGPVHLLSEAELAVFEDGNISGSDFPKRS